MVIGYIKILHILNTKPVDIVHIHMAEKGSTFRKGTVAKWSKKRNKKVIIHLHAGPFMAWYNSQPFNKKRKIRQVFENADQVFVLGEYWKKELTEIIPLNKLTVLYNGVDCPKENPYNPDARNIVYFGVMRKEKGIYDLINAIGLIDNQLPGDVKVILCGKDLEGNIPETIEKAGLKDRFVLPGWVTGEQKQEIVRSAMIDILPSYYEGLSMTILEAMANGIPVITTTISTMPEVLGESGIMVEPGDTLALSKAILKLINNKSERVSISNIERERIYKRFTNEIMIDETLKDYLML